jgi:bifunctional non-homologous end joining protein LigD
LRQKRFVIDSDAVVLDKDGVSDFDALHSRKHDGRAQLYARLRCRGSAGGR